MPTLEELRALFAQSPEERSPEPAKSGPGHRPSTATIPAPDLMKMRLHQGECPLDGVDLQHSLATMELECPKCGFSFDRQIARVLASGMLPEADFDQLVERANNHWFKMTGTLVAMDLGMGDDSTTAAVVDGLGRTVSFPPRRERKTGPASDIKGVKISGTIVDDPLGPSAEEEAQDADKTTEQIFKDIEKSKKKFADAEKFRKIHEEQKRKARVAAAASHLFTAKLNEDGVTDAVLNFGKYRGRMVSELASLMHGADYLRYLLRPSKDFAPLPEGLQEIIRAHLGE